MRSRSPAYPWVLLALLTSFWGLVGLNRIGIAYLFPILVPEFHMAYWQVGLLISGTSFTWAFSSWLSGWLSDHYGRRRVMLPGAAVACASTAAMGGAWNFLSLFIVRDLVGIGDGVGWPNSQAVLAAEFPARRRAFVQAVFTSGYVLFGSVLGALIVTHLAVSLGWRPVFPIIGGVFFFVVLALFFVMKEPTGTTRSESSRIKWRDAISVARNRNVLILMLVQSGALGWLHVSVGYNSLYLTKVRHVDLVQSGTILSIFGVTSLAGTLALPFFSDYIGRKPAMIAGGVLSGLCMALFSFGHFNLVVSVVLLAASGFFDGVLIPLAAATCVVEVMPVKSHATAMGAINFAGVMIGTFLFPLVAGVVADHFGLGSALLLAAVSVGLAGLLVLAIPETAPRVLARRAGWAQAQVVDATAQQN